MDQLRNRRGLTEAEFLAQYDPSRFERPSVTVDMVIFTVASTEEENYRKLPVRELKLLLVKRGDHPYLGQWALPGGFVGMQEGLGEAAARELQEETGIGNIYMEQLFTWGDPGRDPRTRVISCSYLSLVDSTAIRLRAGDDADDARWFTITEGLPTILEMPTDTGCLKEWSIPLTLTADEVRLTATIKVRRVVDGKVTRFERAVTQAEGIAFDHARIIQYGLERLRTKIEWTDIAFNLMPDRFTLTELQQVYEVILQRELLMANFRRKIAPMVIETNEHKQAGGHRPARLYRFNPNWVQNNL